MESRNMFTAVISCFNGAEYRFSSWCFKWVYQTVLHFAKDCVHRYPDLGPILIRFEGVDLRLCVDTDGYVIDTKYQTLELYKED